MDTNAKNKFQEYLKDAIETNNAVALSLQEEMRNEVLGSDAYIGQLVFAQGKVAAYKAVLEHLKNLGSVTAPTIEG